MEKFKAYVNKLRGEARERLLRDKPLLFPDVPSKDFEAIANALGEISIIEARMTLYRMQVEAKKNKV